MATLADRTFRFAERIISADSVSFDCFDRDGHVADNCWRSSPQLVTPELLETYFKYAHQNPVYDDVVQYKRLDPVKLSDYISVTDFEQTDIYRQFFVIIETRYQMATALWVTADFTVTCIFCASQKDFSERDRTMFSMASPHLVNAVRNAYDFFRIGEALEIKNSGVLSIDGNGKVGFASEFVRKRLRKYFAQEISVSAELPGALQRWIN